MERSVIAGYVRSPFQPARRGQLARVRPDELAARWSRAGRAHRRRPGGDRGRDPGLRLPRGRAGHERRPDRRRAGRPAASGGRHHRQPLLRLVDAGDAHGRRRHRDGCRRRLRLRRRRVDDAGCRWAASTRCPTPSLAESYPADLHRDGRDGRERRATGTASRRERPGGVRRCRASARRPRRRPPAGWREEIVPVADGERTSTGDGCLRAGHHLEGLAALKPAFNADGTVTAGTSSPLTDGAAAVLVTSRDVRPRARPGAAGARSGRSPSPAASRRSWASARCASSRKALERAGITVDDIDMVELNEAFASQALACVRELGIDQGRDQPRRRRDRARPSAGRHRRAHHRQGGRSCCGARAARYALATQCIGGGQGIATVLEAV